VDGGWFVYFDVCTGWVCGDGQYMCRAWRWFGNENSEVLVDALVGFPLRRKIPRLDRSHMSENTSRKRFVRRSYSLKTVVSCSLAESWRLDLDGDGRLNITQRRRFESNGEYILLHKPARLRYYIKHPPVSPFEPNAVHDCSHDDKTGTRNEVYQPESMLILCS
jgi:hypothetical protein